MILSYIDQAGAVEAKRHGAEFLVTVAMREVVFHEPVYVGDLVSFYTRLVEIGRTSITISVEVFSQTGEGVGNRVQGHGGRSDLREPRQEPPPRADRRKPSQASPQDSPKMRRSRIPRDLLLASRAKARQWPLD